MGTTVRWYADTVAKTASPAKQMWTEGRGGVDNSNPDLGKRPTVHAMTYRMGPYHVLEDQPGHRSTRVQTWRARDVRSGHEVALSVVANVPADVAHRMVELSVTVRHPHLLPVVDVIVDGSRVGVISSWPPAGRLSDLLERRGPLSVGETLTVLRPVTAALAAIHRHGLLHGNLSAAGVGFDDSGRPLLGGLAAGLIAAQAETDGPAQDAADLAPEVARGAAVSVAADVFSLGSLALLCLTGRSAWPADDPADVLVQSVGGVWPDVPDALAPPRFVALIRRMLASDPGTRPDAPGVLANLQQSGVALPVDLALDGIRSDAVLDAAGAAADVLSGLPAVVLGPASPSEPDGDDEASPTPAAQWGSSRRPGAVRTGPPIVRRHADALGSAKAGSGGASSGGGSSAAHRRHGRQQPVRARRDGSDTTDPHRPALSASRRVAVLGLAAALAVVLGVIGMQAWSSRPGESGPGESGPDASRSVAGSAGTGPVADAADWLAVVTELDTARAQALSAADPALLDRVYTASSAQRSADTAVVADLAAKGLRVRDGTHQIVSATIVPAVAGTAAANLAATSPGTSTGTSTAEGPDDSGSSTVRVAVVDAMPPHSIVDTAGNPVGQTAARSTERRILELASTAQGYRIESILAG